MTSEEDRRSSPRSRPSREDFSRWYLDVVRRAELADYSPVKGCMVIRPYGYAIWELIQQAARRALQGDRARQRLLPAVHPREPADARGGARRGLRAAGRLGDAAAATRSSRSGSIIRPTSEVIIGTMYAKWIKSWRDLPVLINQWANVVRWEKVTRPFLRTTEFLWQEGHTAHETDAEAEEETLQDPRALQGVRRERAGDAGDRRAEERQREVRRRVAHVFDRGADGRRPRAAGRHVAQPRPELRQGVRDPVPGPRQDACSTPGRRRGACRRG